MTGVSRDEEEGQLCLLGTEEVSVWLQGCRELLPSQGEGGQRKSRGHCSCCPMARTPSACRSQGGSPSLPSIPGLPALTRPQKLPFGNRSMTLARASLLAHQGVSTLLFKNSFHSLITRWAQAGQRATPALYANKA